MEFLEKKKEFLILLICKKTNQFFITGVVIVHSYTLKSARKLRLFMQPQSTAAFTFSNTKPDLISMNLRLPVR